MQVHLKPARLGKVFRAAREPRDLRLKDRAGEERDFRCGLEIQATGIQLWRKHAVQVKLRRASAQHSRAMRW